MKIKNRNKFIKYFNKSKYVKKNRKELIEIIKGNNNKFIVVLGPCSISSLKYSKIYFKEIIDLQKKYKKKIKIVLRVYLEKPRTIIGWKGYIYDPDLDQSYNINKGIKKSLKLLSFLNSKKIALSTEFLSNILFNYTKYFMSIGTIGARNYESQIHREFCSDLNFPIGYKNGTSGDIEGSLNSIISISKSHFYINFNKIKKTKGNKNGFLILRGGKNGPNIQEENIKYTFESIKKTNIETGILIDASHDNSGKTVLGQKKSIEKIIQLRKKYKKIIGVMIESYIKEGNIDFNYAKKDKETSITDKCISLVDTKKILNFIYNNI
ncbi:3-deoxy-7-phosphoheptulonate synthase [Candidatus Vidania fulgoroideorum]